MMRRTLQTATQEDRTMTGARQSKQGWLKSWREERRVLRQERIEREHLARQQAGEAGAMHRGPSAYGHSGSPTFFGGFGGGDGGGGGGGCGDGGDGGGC
jgi:hypothetical protein